MTVTVRAPMTLLSAPPTPPEIAVPPTTTAAIAGSRSGGHMRENAAAADVTLPEEVLDELEQLIPLGPAFS